MLANFWIPALDVNQRQGVWRCCADKAAHLLAVIHSEGGRGRCLLAKSARRGIPATEASEEVHTSPRCSLQPRSRRTPSVKRYMPGWAQQSRCSRSVFSPSKGRRRSLTYSADLWRKVKGESPFLTKTQNKSDTASVMYKTEETRDTGPIFPPLHP